MSVQTVSDLSVINCFVKKPQSKPTSPFPGAFLAKLRNTIFANGISVLSANPKESGSVAMKRTLVLISLIILMLLPGCNERFFKKVSSLQIVQDTVADEDADEEDESDESEDEEDGEDDDEDEDDEDDIETDGRVEAQLIFKDILEMRQNASELEIMLEDVETPFPGSGKYDIGLGILVSRREAIKWYRKAADRGNANAQFNLGVLYTTGDTNNPAEAAKWYQKAAVQGHANAQFKLAVMHKHGIGTPVNHEEAIRWYQKAAGQGHCEAQFNLGLIYYDGSDKEANYKEAIKYFQKSAEQGYAKAQFNMGVMVFNGQGTPANVTEAIKWYEKAAIQGHIDAQINLGNIYLKGMGVRRNYVKSYIWTSLAVGLGAEKAEENLNILLDRMSDNQFESAQKTADALRVRYHLTPYPPS